jgi:hypothetical protein
MVVLLSSVQNSHLDYNCSDYNKIYHSQASPSSKSSKIYFSYIIPIFDFANATPYILYVKLIYGNQKSD